MSTGVYVFAVEGLDQLKSFDELPQDIVKAARQAVNKTADRARTRAAKLMREQVNFGASYLHPSQGRLTVPERAQGLQLRAVVRGRRRPTSLARFVSGGATPGRRGVSVEVKPGRVRAMKRSFLMRLKAGNNSIDTKFNLGLAVRTSGQKPARAYKPVPVGKNLWLVYGPSVDQVFRSVAQDITPEMTDFLENEFRRLLDLRGLDA